MEEAARIDGVGTFRTFCRSCCRWRSRPDHALTIPSQGSWNELGHFIIATNKESLYTLTRWIAGSTTPGSRLGDAVPDQDGCGVDHDHPHGTVFIPSSAFFTQGANAGADKG